MSQTEDLEANKNLEDKMVHDQDKVVHNLKEKDTALEASIGLKVR